MKDDIIVIFQYFIIICFYLFFILNTYNDSIIKDCKEKGYYNIKENKFIICQVIIKD